MRRFTPETIGETSQKEISTSIFHGYKKSIDFIFFFPEAVYTEKRRIYSVIILGGFPHKMSHIISETKLDLIFLTNDISDRFRDEYQRICQDGNLSKICEFSDVFTCNEVINISNEKNVDVAICLHDEEHVCCSGQAFFLKKAFPHIEIIFIRDPHVHIFNVVDGTVGVIRRPLDLSKLYTILRRINDRKLMRAKISDLINKKTAPQPSLSDFSQPNLSPLDSLVGVSAKIQEIKDLIPRIATTSMNILVRGQSGTGKDVVSRLIHEISDRKDKGEFHKINCPSIPESLFESEIFGHESGAFTGAKCKKIGLLEMANRGTLFLDEIGDIPPFIQAKLLQFIEHKQFIRVGGVKKLDVDCKIVSATNAHLELLIQQGRFRSDLFFRLNEFCITMPSLQERLEDIPMLVDHFLRNLSILHKRAMPSLSNDILSRLMDYSWPGNIRELSSSVKRYFFSGDPKSILEELQKESGTTKTEPAFAKNLENVEKDSILQALTLSNWNRREAARTLGISYSSIRRKIEKYSWQRSRNEIEVA